MIYRIRQVLKMKLDNHCVELKVNNELTVVTLEY